MASRKMTAEDSVSWFVRDTKSAIVISRAFGLIRVLCLFFFSHFVSYWRLTPELRVAPVRTKKPSSGVVSSKTTVATLKEDRLIALDAMSRCGDLEVSREVCYATMDEPW